MLYIGSDHAGFELKKHIIQYLTCQKIPLEDLGFYNNKLSDYPIISEKVARAVVASKRSFGILVCGTGTGTAIAANRIAGVRAAVGYSQTAAREAREHSNANILTLAGRVLSPEQAEKIVNVFIKSRFSGKVRYRRRIKQLDRICND